MFANSISLIRVLAFKPFALNQTSNTICTTSTLCIKMRRFPRGRNYKGVIVKKTVLHRDIIERHRQKQYDLKHELTVDNIELYQKQAEENDLPIPGLANPYEKPPKRCILCEQNVDVDYKNVRLLSQFVSPYTGVIYGRKNTGLCIYMQKRVSKLIKRARFFGFMPYKMKEPEFVGDPKLFNPFRGPFTPHKIPR